MLEYVTAPHWQPPVRAVVDTRVSEDMLSLSLKCICWALR